MFTNCTIKSKQDIKNKFGSFANALTMCNKYRTDPLTMRQLLYQMKNEVISEEWQAFWSNLAFYEQHQQNLFGDDSV